MSIAQRRPEERHLRCCHNRKATFASVLIQIILLDLVFSLDSVITAVGMVDQVSVMIAAVTVAILVMLVSAEAVAGIVNRHPNLNHWGSEYLYAFLDQSLERLERAMQQLTHRSSAQQCSAPDR
jgi:predicted tellurium resistance membrane protein TerC